MDSFIIFLMALFLVGLAVEYVPWYVFLFIIVMGAYVVVRAVTWTRRRL